MKNWGHALNAGIGGFMQGMQMGREIKGMRNEMEIDRIRREGLEAAQKSFDQDTRGRIERFDTEDGQTRFRVGDLDFDSEDQALEKARKGQRSVSDRFHDMTSERLYQTYTRQGRLDEAAKLREFTNTRQAREQFQDFNKGLQAFQSGNTEGTADYMMRHFSEVMPGAEMQSIEPIIDNQGNRVGYNLTLNHNGRVVQQQIDEGAFRNLAENIFFNTNPQAQAERWLQQYDSAQAAGAQAQNQERRDTLQYQRGLEKLDYQHRLQDERDDRQYRRGLNTDTHRKQLEIDALPAKAAAQAQALREYGVSDEFIASAIPQMLGVRPGEGMYRKGPSPEEMAHQVNNQLLSNQMYFLAPPAKQAEMRNEAIRALQEMVQAIMQSPVGPNQGIMIRDNQTGNTVPLR
jgi:hypothetical protein